jgi:cytidine deaminase
MSGPFPADASFAERVSTLESQVGAGVRAAVVERTVAGGDRAWLGSWDASGVARTHGLADMRELAVLALPAAATLARPPISDYRVGAVGVTPDGDLVLGGNLEFPGASIHHTVHGEGFVTLRARARGVPLAILAIRTARPCAHCRQVLTEMAWARDLRLIDPEGHDLSLEDLYPWPFSPADLAHDGAGVRVAGPDGGDPRRRDRAALVSGSLPDDVSAALADALPAAHAPYSGEPAAIVVRTGHGLLVAGAVLESVAFNPTIGPLQDALVALVARGVEPSSITDAWLGTVGQARVDHVGPTRDLLAAVAPHALLHVTHPG